MSFSSNINCKLQMEPYNGIRSLQYSCKKRRITAFILESMAAVPLGRGGVMCGDWAMRRDEQMREKSEISETSEMIDWNP